MSKVIDIGVIWNGFISEVHILYIKSLHFLKFESYGPSFLPLITWQPGQKLYIPKSLILRVLEVLL